MSLRILTLANHTGSVGGLERHQLMVCRGLAERGHLIELMYQTAGSFAQDWDKFVRGSDRIEASMPARSRPFSSSAQMAKAIVGGLRKRPDIVYVFRPVDLLCGGAIARFARAKAAFHMCLPPPTRVPAWLGIGLRSVDLAIANSAYTANTWRATGDLRAARLSTVRQGIDLLGWSQVTEDERRVTRAQLGVTASEFLVLYAGRITPSKGVHILLRGFREFHKHFSDSALVIVGDASLADSPGQRLSYRTELQCLSDGLPVRWVENRSDIRAIIGCADVAVLPSIEPETAGRFMMEAIALGVVPIASRIGGIPEYFPPFLEGNLIDPGDARAIAARLESAREGRRSAPMFATMCIEYARSSYDLDQEVRAVESAFLERSTTGS